MGVVQAEASLLAFISTYLGRRDAGTNPQNRGQCVGLVELWLRACGMPLIAGNAADLLSNASLPTYRLIRNTPTNAPPLGAVVCWDKTWGEGFGHTAIVVASNITRLVVFEQNDPIGALPLVMTHSYSGVSGWLTWAAPALPRRNVTP